jgi:hypothetical protein
MKHMTKKTMKRMALGVVGAAWVAMGAGCVPAPEVEVAEEASAAASFSKRSNALKTRLMCRATFECPQASGELVAVLGRYADEDACVAGAARMVRDVSRDDEMLQIGATLDEERARACIEVLEAQLRRGACGLDPNPPECDGVLVGPGAEGDACGEDYHCGAGLHCDAWEGEGCGGACVPDASGDAREETCGDEVCGEDERCVADDATYTSATCVAAGTLPAGAFCDYVDDACASGLECDYNTVTCEPAEPESAAQLGGAGQVCDLSDAPCGPGLACAGHGVLHEGGDGVCVPVKGAGEPCAHALECAPDLACLTGEGDGALGEGTCAAPAADGARCHLSLGCASGYCERGVCARRELTRCAP